jgi:RNA polymerase sigma factor (TIGR02999 family)
VRQSRADPVTREKSTVDTPSHTATELLNRAARGEAGAARELAPLVYEKLRSLARRYMEKEPAGQTLDATALVHEAYLRLTGGADVAWKSRAHFFGAAAQAMRRILIERARRYRRVKRGAGWKRVSLDALAAPIEERAAEILALDEALDRLHALDPRKHEVVMLRFFAGLTAEDTARVLAVSPETVKRDWRFARAWLQGEAGDGR